MALILKRWNHPLLTNVQNEIVPSICDDCLSTKEVADKHCVSINTVASHKKNIFATLNITKVTELSKIYYTGALNTLLIISGLVLTFVDIDINRPTNRKNITETAVISRSNNRRRRKERSVKYYQHNNKNYYGF